MLSAPMMARLRMSLSIRDELGRRLFAGEPYTIARLTERHLVPMIYFGDLGGDICSTSICICRLT